jgi:phosphoglycolate phosphatase
VDFKNKKLIIFDFDGTLINSIPDLTLAVNKMLEKYNRPALTIEQTTPFIGNGAKTLVKRALNASFGEENVSESFFNEAFKVYLNSYKENCCVGTYLYPGVKETLLFLQEKNYQMAICTNKPFAFIEPILQNLEITPFFDYWIGEDSLSEKKPSAIPLLHIAEKLEVSVKDSLMVGDSKNDILAGQNAGMDTLGLTYGYNYNENISDYNPTVVKDRFSDLKVLF